MDSTEGMRKAIADRKASLVKSLKVLDEAVKESQTIRQERRDEQRRQD
ncbi:hypothetical protein ES708_13409 [subsurface metagenome]